MKVILKPTDFKNNEIFFNAFSSGGTSLYPDADYQSAANASGLIQSFGAGNYNITELSKYLSGKQIAIQCYISERTQGVNGQSTAKDIETALEIMYAFLTEPRKDETIFKNIIQRSKVSIANRENDPATVYKDSVSAVLSSHNIRCTAPI